MIFGGNPFGSKPYSGARAGAESAAEAMASNSVVIVQLIHMAFATPIALNTSTWNLTWDGVDYLGAHGLGSVSAITDKPGELQGLTFELFGDTAMITAALDDADVVQETVVTIRTAILSATTYQIIDAPIEWVGKLDTMGTSEDGERATIHVSAESKAIDLLRGTPMFYSDADQRTVNANDGSFMYVVDQIDKPVVWPARTYFYR